MGSLYDELAAQPAPQPGAAQPTLYDDLVETERQERAVRGSLTATAQTTPERAAQLNYLAQVSGMPRAVVETDEGSAKAVAQLREIWDASADSPVLRAKLANPQFTELAKDDVGVLSQIERGVQATTRYIMGADGRGGLAGDVKAGFHRSSAATSGAFRAVAETLAVPFDFLEQFTAIGGNPLRRLAEGFESIAQGQTRIADRTTSGVFGVSAGVQSAVQNSKYLPLVAAGPAGAAAALTGMVAESFGSSYQTARDRGVSQAASLIYGASDAAIEYATERIPLQRLIGDIAVDAGFVRTLGRQIALEVPGEQIATVLQDMNEWAVLNPERSFRDYLAERPSAAAETLIATVIGTGGNVALTQGVDRALNGYLQAQVAQTEAGQQALAVQQLLEMSAQSRLRERDPAQFREAVAEMARQAGTESVFVDAAVLNQLPPEIQQQLPGLAEQLADALAANSTVELKLADVLAVAPGSGVEQTLVDNIRMAPDALTAAEATAAGQEAQTLLQQEATRVIAQAGDAVQAQAAAEQVKADVLGQLNATGRFGAEVNDAYATLVRDFYTVLGQRLGVSPAQAYQRYPLRVAGQGQGTAAVLEQESPEFKAWFGDSKVVDADGKPLVVYHGTRADFDTFSPEATMSAGRVESEYGRAFYFTTDPATAESYGESARQDGAHRVLPVYLSLRNPYIVDLTKVAVRSVYAPGHDPEFVNRLKAKGHDGIIVVDEDFDGNLPRGTENLQAFASEVVVFEPTQIKSAIGNSGTYDPNDPNILNQSADPADDIATTLLELGRGEGLYQLPRSQATDIAQMAAEKDLEVRPVDRNAADSTEWMLANTTPEAEGTESWVVSTSDGRLGTITRDGNEVYINVSAVGEGGGGSAIYDLVANYALNNGLVFIGDPNGVSEAAMRRRLENMLSSAVKYGTTDHIAPHPDQLLGNTVQGIAPLKWTPGDTLGNIRSLVEASLATTEAAAPLTTSEVQFDVDTQQFRQPDGTPADAAVVRSVLSFEPRVRGTGAPGQTTVQRAALYRALLQGPDQRRALLAAVRGQQGERGEGLGRTFYQRAKGTFDPAKLLITLNDGADLSTFLHETGHFFLEVTADLAAAPDAPAQVQQDMAALLKWFGVPDLQTWQAMSLDEQRPHHERFAESFEQYLLEGRAPSRDLRSLFRKFRSFLTRVYRSLQSFTEGRDVELSDDVRQVMDRLLATDEQIAEAQTLAGMDRDQAATDEALEKFQARSLRDLKWAVNARAKVIAKLQAQARNLRKGIEAEVRAEVEEVPVYKAMRWLREDTKLSIEGLESLYMGEGDRYALLDWKPLVDRRMAGKTGVHPDVAADMFGFPSGDALVRAILAAEPLSEVVQGRTDQRMLERHGDLIDQRAIEEAATEAIHNEARARALATELAAQREIGANRRETGQVDARGRALTVNATLEAARQFAENVAGRKAIGDLKSAAYAHLQAERRAAKAWEAATAKGDTQAAVQAKQDQLLNHEIYRALVEAQRQVAKAEALFARVLKGNPERLVDRGYDPDVVAATRAILAAYGLAPRIGKTAVEYLELVEKNDPDLYAVLKPSVEATLANAKPYDRLSVDELGALVAEVEAMQQLARRSRQMEVDGNLMDLQEAADQLKARMEAIGVPLQMPGQDAALTPKQERTRWLQFARALGRRMEQWSEAMDGGRGAFTKLVYGPVKAAADRYRADRAKYRKQYQQLVDRMAPALRPGEIAAPELGYTFGRGHNGIGHAELLHALLHTGNESNKRKLLLGRGWASENGDGSLDTSRWDAFVARMQSSGYLAKEHYDFAQGVWDLLESTKPLAQKAHRDVFGRYFAEVTADAFETPYGAYRGGHVPAQADPRIVTDAGLRKLAEMENENMAFSFPTTSKGFTKARTDYNRPLILDLRTIGQHLDKVLLFSHMEPAVRDVNRLLRDRGVSARLSKIDPAAYEGALIPWLNRSARQQVETPVVGDGRISRVLSVMRSRAGMSLMFANVSNTAQQITGFALAAVKVKPSKLLQATAQYIANPKKTADFVAEQSIFMRDRMRNEVAAINDAMDDILLKPSTYAKTQTWAQRHAYFLQAAADNVMSPIVWVGAYNQALETGQTETEAAKAGDAAVRQTQGSTLPEDVSRIETGPAAARMFTQFVSYFNMLANTNSAELTKIARDIGMKKGAGKALYVVTMGLLVPIWVAEAIAIAFRGGPEDEDGDGWLDDWLAAVFGMGTIKGSLAMVPFVGQAANAGLARLNDNPADDRISLSPAVSILEGAVGAPHSVYQALAEDGSARKAVRDLASAISLATGLPAHAAARPLGYLAGMADDRVAPTSGLDLARGLVTGAVSPESRQ
ncbi:hypothetical protein Q5W_15460 [Hydrogenophaga sp. PBC]|uniref:ADP-ribosyltransferase-containing protein n=1 Tax=Hydrogenophaga sp. PBC TaxID=795665 RepID=UPI0008544C50|nr:hypothetical protein [Hydrogenophaga sp. PBC]AOS80267.1 hypothetical protein Q5W_15460 [Hydrogenophaga sp. PBC]